MRPAEARRPLGRLACALLAVTAACATAPGRGATRETVVRHPDPWPVWAEASIEPVPTDAEYLFRGRFSNAPTPEQAVRAAEEAAKRNIVEYVEQTIRSRYAYLRRTETAEVADEIVAEAGARLSRVRRIESATEARTRDGATAWTAAALVGIPRADLDYLVEEADARIPRETIEAAAARVAKELAESLGPAAGGRVAVADFSYGAGETALVTPLGRLLAQEVAAALASGRFGHRVVIETGPAAVRIEGAYHRLDRERLVEIRAVARIPAGAIIGGGRASVRAAALPALPENVRMEDLARLIQLERRGDVDLEIETDRGPRAVYREGEEVRLLLRADRPCSVALLNITVTEGDFAEVVVLVPQGAYRGLWSLDGTRVYRYPEDYTGRPEGATVRSPYGVEVVMAVASSGPFEIERLLPGLAPAPPSRTYLRGKYTSGRLAGLLGEIAEDGRTSLATAAYATAGGR